MAANRLGRSACFVVATVLLGACAAGDRTIPPATSGLPVRAAVADVRYLGPSAGTVPVATAMVLDWTGLRVSPSDLAEGIADGDLSRSVVRVTRRHGRLAYPLDDLDEILHELAAGHPVLLCQGANVEATDRCFVLVGYDLTEESVRLHSSQGPNRDRPLAEIVAAWAATGAWALVILPPGDLPATVEKEEYITAAAGLERDGPAWEAVLALDTALALWTDSVDALMGLGKSLLALGDRNGAAEAFASASQLTDDPAVARWQWAVVQVGLAEEPTRPPTKPGK